MSPNSYERSGTLPQRKIVPVVPRSFERQAKTQQERGNGVSTGQAHSSYGRKFSESDEGKAEGEHDQDLQIEISGDLSQDAGSQEAELEGVNTGKPYKPICPRLARYYGEANRNHTS